MNSNNKDSALCRVHWVRIKVMTKYGGGELVETLFWEGLPWHTRNRFTWYFKYRTALLQVKYPHYHVEMYWGNEDAEGKSLAHILKDRIAGKKRMITKITNNMELAKKHWDSLFPIEEDRLWILSANKLAKYKKELKEVEEQLSNCLK